MQRLMIMVALALFLCGAAVYFTENRRPLEASWHGRVASYWLQQILCGPKSRAQAFQAFREMGTNADPVLFSALQGGETLFGTELRRLHASLPATIRQRLPQPMDPAALRSAAGSVVLNTGSESMIPKLMVFFKDLDSTRRRQVLASL